MDIDPNTAIHGIIFTFLGWMGQQLYSRNACLKRLEQKIDDFIKYHTDDKT